MQTQIQINDNRIKLAPLRHFAPNFRCVTYGNGKTWVEIPDGWQSRYHWDGSAETEEAINRLCREHGKRGRVYECGGNGWLVPVAAWDAEMDKPAGWTWDRNEITDAEALAIIRKAKQVA